MRNRAGFTMIEVLIAMAILGIAVLSIQAALTTRFFGDVVMQDQQALANQLAQDRIVEIQLHPDYDDLEDRFEEAETELADFPGLTRETVVNRTTQPNRSTGQTLDFTTITVTIRGGNALRPVSRTTVVGERR